MVDYSFIARILLGAYLAFTGVVKIPDLKGFVLLVSGYGGLSAKFRQFAYVIPFAEAFIGIALMTGYYIKYVSMLAILMLLAYTFAISVALYQQREMENCGCFGTWIKVKLTYWSLVEDLACIAAAVFILASVW